MCHIAHTSMSLLLNYDVREERTFDQILAWGEPNLWCEWKNESRPREHHNGIWGNGGIDSLILNLGATWRFNSRPGSFAPDAYRPVPWSIWNFFEKKKISCPYRESNTESSVVQPRSLTTTPSEIGWEQKLQYSAFFSSGRYLCKSILATGLKRITIFFLPL